MRKVRVQGVSQQQWAWCWEGTLQTWTEGVAGGATMARLMRPSRRSGSHSCEVSGEARLRAMAASTSAQFPCFPAAASSSSLRHQWIQAISSRDEDALRSGRANTSLQCPPEGRTSLPFYRMTLAEKRGMVHCRGAKQVLCSLCFQRKSSERVLVRLHCWKDGEAGPVKQPGENVGLCNPGQGFRLRIQSDLLISTYQPHKALCHACCVQVRQEGVQHLLVGLQVQNCCSDAICCTRQRKAKQSGASKHDWRGLCP